MVKLTMVMMATFMLIVFLDIFQGVDETVLLRVEAAFGCSVVEVHREDESQPPRNRIKKNPILMSRLS
jgi:hypothetical protein